MSNGQRNSSYQTAIEFLYELSWFGARLGLETSRKLAELADNPQRTLRFIHVAGTNGKGSTCAILESIYRAAGLRVGLFTSPHLVSFRERIQINREMIPEADVVRFIEKLPEWMKEFSGEDQPTFFEAITVMALSYFAKQKCDLVIWETGLGGRLDATNIVTPLAVIITNIQYDHQKWLGESLAKIATEKAGIIKPNVPVITGADQPETQEIIAKTASERNAPLTIINSTGHFDAEIRKLSLSGAHQRRNAVLALATVEILQNVIPVSTTAIGDGLAAVQWSGRLQIVSKSPGQKIVLDGAHNVDGAQALARSLGELFPGRRPTLILGILRDKDWSGMFRVLAHLADKTFLVSVQSERSASPEEMAAKCQAINPTAEVVACASLSIALATTEHDSLVVIAGSLYLIGEALELLGLAATACGERGLNEWSGPISRQTT